MAEKNPYCFRAMIPIESDMFFGREREMRRIGDLLSGETPQCVSIIGERRIGKSSLASRVFHELRKAPGTRAVYIDCDGLANECGSKDEFFQWLNRKFKDASGEKGKTTLFSDYSSFKAFIGSCGKKGVKTVIFLDEFEHLPHDETNGNNAFADNTFFSNLRAMANDPANRLAFVALSKTGLKELTHRCIRSSGFWNIFQVEPVGLLEEESIDGLRRHGFEKTGFSLTAEEREKVHYYAGHFPFFNQVVCGFLWDAKANKTEPVWDDVEVALLPFYKKLWEDRSAEEQERLKKLKGDADMTVKELKSRGVVIKEEERFRAFSDYFSQLIAGEMEIKKERLWRRITLKIGEILELVRKGKKSIEVDS